MRKALTIHLLAVCALAGGAAAQAVHVPFGKGCREVARESFAFWFADGAAAAAALTGQSLLLQPQADGYLVSWGGATFRSPSAAAVALPPVDDGQTAVTPTLPLPTPQGPLPTLWVHSNGFVSATAANTGGAWNAPANDYLPTAEYRNAPATAFWAWHDWDPAEPGSGRIVHEEVQLAGERTLCVTWNGVENFPVGVANRGTFQFQFGLQTGRVAYVWLQVDAASSSVFGSAHLVGYSPGGPSLDGGWRSLPGDLPLVTSADQRAMSLWATPPPRSTAAAGTTLTYTSEHVPPVFATANLRLGVTVLSLDAAPGVDLGAVGAPGCRAYVRSFDLQLSWLGVGSTVDVHFDLPPGLPAGLSLFAQSVAVVEPPSPGALGIATSDGIESRIAPF